MITAAEAELILPAGERAGQAMGSILHGHLIECLSVEWADAMHTEQVRPYSQYVYQRGGHTYWRVNTLTSEAREHILEFVMRAVAFHSTQRGYAIGIDNFHVLEETSYEALETSCWSANTARYVNLDMHTSTSFKVAGQYAIFPEPALLFKNLITKWNMFATSSVLEEAELAEHLAESLAITGYHLQLVPYPLEGRQINAFTGRLSLGRFQNDTARRMVAMLLSFAQYAGLGIKTALGMGGLTTTIKWQIPKGTV